MEKYKLILKNKNDTREEITTLTPGELKEIYNGITTGNYFKFFYTTLCKSKYQNAEITVTDLIAKKNAGELTVNAWYKVRGFDIVGLEYD
jgi:hypothetical protein